MYTDVMGYSRWVTPGRNNCNNSLQSIYQMIHGGLILVPNSTTFVHVWLYPFIISQSTQALSSADLDPPPPGNKHLLNVKLSQICICLGPPGKQLSFLPPPPLGKLFLIRAWLLYKHSPNMWVNTRKGHISS